MPKVWLPNWVSSDSMFRCNTRMAVITTIMENTPTRTPNSVSADRSLCATNAFMAIRKLSLSSALKMRIGTLDYGLRDHGTTGPRDHGTTGPRTTGPRTTDHSL